MVMERRGVLMAAQDGPAAPGAADNCEKRPWAIKPALNLAKSQTGDLVEMRYHRRSVGRAACSENMIREAWQTGDAEKSLGRLRER